MTLYYMYVRNTIQSVLVPYARHAVAGGGARTLKELGQGDLAARGSAAETERAVHAWTL